MDIIWLGHSTFKLISADGVSIITDPYDPSVGHTLQNLQADIVTVSHDHHDHNYTEALCPGYTLINTTGAHCVCGVKITGFETSHDDQGGALRGKNIAYLYELDGMRILHAGDLGVIPPPDTIEAIGKVDVLLVPIGGTYTVDYQGARELANHLSPKVVIPMHYRTDPSTLQIDTIDRFLTHVKDCAIHRLNQSEATLTPDSLGDDRVLVLDWQR